MFMMGIRDERKKRGMSQKDLAKELHIDAALLCRYENGTIELPEDRMIQIARILNTRLDYIRKDNVPIHKKTTSTKSNINNPDKEFGPTENPSYYSTDDDITKTIVHRVLDLIVTNIAHCKCEWCHSPAPFTLPDGMPYLEFIRINKTISETFPEAWVAVCPNCRTRYEVMPNIIDRMTLEKIAKTHEALYQAKLNQPQNMPGSEKSE